MIYGRFGGAVIIKRLATAEDVRRFVLRNPDRIDREYLKRRAYLVIEDAIGRERLCLRDSLKADDGSREINAAFEELP